MPRPITRFSQDGPKTLALLDALARAPAERSLCRPGQARGLSLARRLQAPGDRRPAQALPARAAHRRVPGAAPGGWSQVAAAETRSKAGAGRVIAIDLLEMDPVEGVEFRRMDFHDPDAPGQLREWLAGLADGVLSDMAANATGHRKTDHLRIVGLVELAADFASEVLAPHGFFVAKVLQGGAEGELLARLKREFATVRHVKPKASRADSAELYVVATGFRGPRPAVWKARGAGTEVLFGRPHFWQRRSVFKSLGAKNCRSFRPGPAVGRGQGIESPAQGIESQAQGIESPAQGNESPAQGSENM